MSFDDLQGGEPVVRQEMDREAEGIVQTIILWRIYDTLLVVLDALGGDPTTLAKLHERGVFLGPNPSFASGADGE